MKSRRSKAAYAILTHGNLLGPNATIWLRESIQRDLVRQFGPLRNELPSDVSLSVDVGAMGGISGEPHESLGDEIDEKLWTGSFRDGLRFGGQR